MREGARGIWQPRVKLPENPACQGGLRLHGVDARVNGYMGRWTGCKRKPAWLYRWARRQQARKVASVDQLQRHLTDLYYCDTRRHRGEASLTGFVESAVNEMVVKRVHRKQPMRWYRAAVQSSLDVHGAVLDDTLDNTFRHRYPGFRSANDNGVLSKPG
jgi:hypothetical protein